MPEERIQARLFGLFSKEDILLLLGIIAMAGLLFWKGHERMLEFFLYLFINNTIIYWLILKFNFKNHIN